MSTPTLARLEPAPQPRLSVEDISYVLLRHKWTILLCTVAGLFAASTVYRLWPDTVYRSDAKLFIRYLQETKAPDAIGNDSSIMSSDQRGETIINNEMEILMSMDLAYQVAARIGPEVILKDLGGGSDPDAAAAAVHAGLSANAPRGSRVVTVSFQHPDRSLPQIVLKDLIDEYRKKHVEIHRGTGLYDDVLSKETLLLRTRLTETEEELRKVKERAGVISLDESKRAYAEQMSKIRQDIFETKAEVAERKAWLAKVGQPSPEEEKIPADTKREYRNVLVLLDAFNRREQELLYSYTAEAPVVTSIRRNIAEKEEQKAALEKKYPNLIKLVAPPPPASSINAAAVDEQTAISKLETKVAVLEKYLEQLRTEASELGALELSISDLQRKRDLQEQHYRYFSASLERSRINETLDSGTVSNISDIEKPTPPERDVGKLYKIVGGLAGGGFLVGIGMAFALEFFVDRSIKRPRELLRVVTAPLLLSIPRLKLGRYGYSHVKLSTYPYLNSSGNGTHPAKPKALWPPEHPIHSYIDSLRNHVIQNFEIRNFTHKPKLVGITACDKGSGVSTVASGLAASLSKIGEGNVLLVDMNPGQSTPHYFRNGAPTPELSEILEGRNGGELSENEDDHLFVATAANQARAALLPNRFTHLVPKFKESDFDFVIFDMPPVNQLTSTAQFARHMDLMIMIVEAEKTSRDMVDRVSMLLSATCGHVGMVLNKTRSYLPRTFTQDA